MRDIVSTFRNVSTRSDQPHLFLGPPGTGKSHLAQALGRAVILQGHCVVYREAHTLLEELADASLDGTRKAFVAELTAVPLLIIDDLGMRKLPHTAAEDLLEIIMRRYERASHCSHRTGRSTTGANCSATPQQSPRSSIVSYITPMSSSAVLGAGAPKSTPTCAPRSPRSRTPLVSTAPCVVAGFAVSISGRI